MILRILLTALAITLAATAHAHAGPIFGAIGALASSLFAGGIGAAALKVVGSIAINLVGGLVQRAFQKKNEPTPSGVKLEVEVGDDADIGFVVGYYATPGTRKYIGTHGSDGKTPNAYLTEVVQVGDRPAPGLPEFWVNGEKVTLLTDQPGPYGWPVQEYRRNGQDYLWFGYWDGTQTTANEFLLNLFGNNGDRPWQSDMIGRGCPYFTATARFNRDLHKGKPEIICVPPPQAFYDIRKDSTAGGSGAHRWGIYSTYEPTTNPAVIIYNIIRGVYYDGSIDYREWLFGGQDLPAFRLPASNWIAAANECDVLIDLVEGGQERQFRCGYEIRGSEEPLAVIEKLLVACSGRLSLSGGLFKILVGAPGAAVYAFTDDDIVITEGQSLKPFPTLDETINGIEARYPEPAEEWQLKDAPARFSSELEAADGDRRLATGITFEACPFSVQVQRLMKTMVEEERRFLVHSFHLPPEAWALEPNDVVSWTSPRNGYTGKKFLVDRVLGQRNENQVVLLKEIEPGEDYAWNPETDEQLQSVGFLGPIRPPVQVMTGWQVEPATIFDANGNARRPSIEVFFDGDLDDVRDVRVRVRLTETQAVIFDGILPYGDPEDAVNSVVLNGTFLPATDYEAQGQFLPFSGRETTPSAWLPVTTPNIRLGDNDVFLPGMLAEINAAVEDLLDWINNPESPLAPTFEDILEQLAENEAALADANAAITQQGNDLTAEVATRQAEVQAEAAARIADATYLAERFRRLSNEQANIALVVSELSFEGYQQRESIRREIKVESDALTSRYTEAITVAIDGPNGVANRIQVLEVASANFGAAISAEQTARVTAIEALAQEITLLSVGTDQQFDWFRLWEFDSTIDGWTGNGTPTWVNGFLRPANQASDPYVTSPRGVGASATQYRQVRLRVRKVGTPTWEGFVWWRGEGVETWSTTDRATIAEPAYDADGFGQLVVNLDWTGTIDQIRLDISAAADASNYFLIDWVSIGRPSPGASRASILAEQTARSTADAALADSISILSTSINDLEGEVAGQATVLDQTVASVTALDGAVTVLSSQVSSLSAEVPGKADAAALDQLLTQVESYGLDGIFSQARGLRSLQAQLDNVALLVTEQDFANKQDSQNALKAVADAYSLIETYARQIDDRVEVQARRVDGVSVTLGQKADAAVVTSQQAQITLQGQQITSLSSAVTTVQNALPGLATTTVTNGLETRLTAAEGTINSQSSAITAINSTLPGLATVSVTNALNTRLTSAEDAIGSQASLINGITSALPGKADVSVTNGLNTRLTSAENTITSQGNAITALNSSVAGKADASAVNALSTRVTATESAITSQGSQITAVSSALGTKADLSYAQFLESVISGNFSYLEGVAAGQAGAIQSLDTRVTQTESVNTSQASSITSLSSALGTKADVAYAQFLESVIASNFDYLNGIAGSQATALQVLTAALGGNSAEIRTQFSASAAPDGYAARYGLTARINSGDSYRQAGFFIDITSDPGVPSRVVFLTNQFVITDGSNVRQPFVFQDGVARMNVANIGTVTAGVLQSQNGKVIFDLNAGVLTMDD
jgi:uncharacterized coiled-coil protein SlyX